MYPKNEGRKKDILAFIAEYLEKHGVSPSIYTIANNFGCTAATVLKYLNRLEEEGAIVRRGKNQIILQAMDGDNYTVPILGTVPCGPLEEQTENIEGYLRLPEAFVGKGKFYLLKAFGQSMIEAGIDEGDYVLVRQQEDACDGQIVVARVNNEVTLKRFYRDDKYKRVRLHPENRTMNDIFVKECIIQGVAVKVLKDL